MNKDECPNCGAHDISEYSFSPDDKPYVVRTEYTCCACKYFWCEED